MMLQPLALSDVTAAFVAALSEPVAVLYLIVISGPVEGADCPLVLIETRMFSTLAALSALLSSHVLRKQ